MKLLVRAFSDYKCGEFHITPVLTLAWPQKDLQVIKSGGCLALEWGFWAVWIGYYTMKKEGGKEK